MTVDPIVAVPTILAHLNGQLVNRKNNPYNFHSICDDFFLELN